MAGADSTKESAANATSVLQVQQQIRANASELQDYFSDLYTWEKTIQKKEEATKSRAKAKQNIPLPRGQKTTTVNLTPTSAPETIAPVEGPTKKADAHTYDKGYKKWDKFDVDAALQEADDDDSSKKQSAQAETTTTSPPTKKVMAKPKTGSVPAKSREDIEREEGNEHYKRGDYVAAIKSYTRCLGFNSKNAIVLSNRAMAYLKNREYKKAEDDCTLALKIDPAHVKSYSRRGTARNALGKHRLALLDFERAREFDPKSKQLLTQIASTKESMRTAIKRAPKKTDLLIQVIGETTNNTSKLNEETSTEDNENSSQIQNTSIKEAASKAMAADKTPPPPAPSTKSTLVLPKLPKKAPSTSYEFGRVWKTLVPKGEPEHARQLWELRGTYLRMLSPAVLPTLFKNSIESDVLCDVFATIRQVFSVTGDDKPFVMEWINNLCKVPRFDMTIMFLSDKEKTDIAWTFDQLVGSSTKEEGESLQQLKKQFGLT